MKEYNFTLDWWGCFTDRLTAGLQAALASGEFSDIVVNVGHRKFNCHSVILGEASEYFKDRIKLFASETKRKRRQINLDGIQPAIFETLLLMVYTARDLITNKNVGKIIELTSRLSIPHIHERAVLFQRTIACSDIHPIRRDNINPELIERLVKSLSNVRASGDYTDVTLTNADCEFPCHQLIISIFSDYIRDYSGRSFRGNPQDQFRLYGHESDTIEDVLTMLYTGGDRVEASNILYIHKLATSLRIDIIKDRCLSYDPRNFRVSNFYPTKFSNYATFFILFTAISTFYHMHR